MDFTATTWDHSSVPAPSNSQVNKAGRTLRHWFRGDQKYKNEHLEAAVAARETVEAFRAAHAAPLVTANNSLRSMLRTENCPIEVSQRLKRMTTIMNKVVVREPTLALSKMQDIGGVRAVVHSVDQIERVEARLRKNREVVGYSDYIANPRPSGYRGVHVIVQYGQDNRQIEIQLRTRIMHEWAITVERLSSQHSENFKQDGNTPVQRFMAAASEAMAYEERGEEVPLDLARTIEALRRDLPSPHNIRK